MNKQSRRLLVRRGVALVETEALLELFPRRAEGARQLRDLRAAKQQRDHRDDEEELPTDDFSDYRMHGLAPRRRKCAGSDTRGRPRPQRQTRHSYGGFDAAPRSDESLAPGASRLAVLDPRPVNAPDAVRIK